MAETQAVPLIHEPMKLYERFRHDAESMALLAVQRAPTTQAAEDAYAPVHRLTMMVMLLSGDNLDAAGALALIRKLQDDVAGVQHLMYEAVMRRRTQDERED